MSAIEMVTKSASGDSWVDSIPGAVSTGYQTQNISSEAVRSGIDTVHFTTNGFSVTAEIGGVVDENGIIFVIKTAVNLSLSTKPTGYYCFSLIDGDTVQDRLIQIDSYIEDDVNWISSKNAFYTDSNRRILNTLMSYDASTNSVTFETFLPKGYSQLNKRYAETRDFFYSPKDIDITRYLKGYEIFPQAFTHDPVSDYAFCIYEESYYYAKKKVGSLVSNEFTILKKDIVTGAEVEIQITVGSTLDGHAVQSIQVTSTSIIVFDTGTKNIFVYNKSTGNLTTNFLIDGLLVTSIFVDSVGDLWVYDSVGGKLTHYSSITNAIAREFDMEAGYLCFVFVDNYAIFTYKNTDFFFGKIGMSVFFKGEISMNFLYISKMQGCESPNLGVTKYKDVVTLNVPSKTLAVR